MKTKKRVTGTREWAKYSFNIQTGCEHDCLYCFAKAAAIRFKRATPKTWTDPKLRGKITAIKKLDGRIMFPTTHDITPLNLDACVKVLVDMLKAGNEVLIVSKPHLDCIVRLVCDLSPWKDQVMFRFTIGTRYDGDLMFWEPGAPKFKERLDCLKAAFDSGFYTSVSCEPLLEDNMAGAVRLVARLIPFVTDSIWMGRANGLAGRIALNCPNDPRIKAKARELAEKWNDAEVKKLYAMLKDEPLVKWKDSMKTVVGIAGQEEAGQDT